MIVTKAKWALPLLLLAACNKAPEASNATSNAAHPAPPPAVNVQTNASAPAEPAESYRAIGQEPGWTVTIADNRIDYVGDYGETKISVPRPEPTATSMGRRYETPQLLLDVVKARCNDAMSGHGYEDQVTITANGKAYVGCGGARRKNWDI
jgi:uncharacterized membrane protein